MTRTVRCVQQWFCLRRIAHCSVRRPWSARSCRSIRPQHSTAQAELGTQRTALLFEFGNTRVGLGQPLNLRTDEAKTAGWTDRCGLRLIPAARAPRSIRRKGCTIGHALGIGFPRHNFTAAGQSQRLRNKRASHHCPILYVYALR